MKRLFITGFFLFILNIGSIYCAEDKILVPIIFHGDTNTKALDNRPEEVSGIIEIALTNLPEQINDGKYIIEYFLDDRLIDKIELSSLDEPAGIYVNTEKYSNGYHKLIVNFWDLNGKPGVAIKHLIIKNEN